MKSHHEATEIVVNRQTAFRNLLKMASVSRSRRCCAANSATGRALAVLQGIPFKMTKYTKEQKEGSLNCVFLLFIVEMKIELRQRFKIPRIAHLRG